VNPERRIASRLRSRYKLVPPVDVEWLAGQLADVEEDSIPHGIDAVAISAEFRARPLIVIARDCQPQRRRFALAHEIGHLRIAWHVGTILCHAEGVLTVERSIYGAMEWEANQFASELLVPSDMLRACLDRAESMSRLIKAARECNVSDYVVTHAVAAVLPPGSLMVLLDKVGTVRLACPSPGTTAPRPRKGRSLDTTAYEPYATEIERFPGSAGEIVHVTLPFEDVLESRERGLKRRARSLLDDALAATIPEAQRSGERARVLSVISYASRRLGAVSASEVLHAMKQRLSAHADLAALGRSAAFQEYLPLEAQVIAIRRSRKEHRRAAGTRRAGS